jgi:hypothetical protein
LGKARGVVNEIREDSMSELNVPMEFRDLFRTDDIAGDVSLPDRSVTTDLSTVAGPTEDPIGSFIKAQRDGLNKTLVPDTDPAWSAPLEPLEKRAEVIKKFVDGEWRTYINVNGKLVEHGREKLFSI